MVSWVRGLDCRGGGGVLWAGSLRWWGLGQGMVGRVRPESVGSEVGAGRSAGGRWLRAWLGRARMGGGSWGEVVSFLRPEGPGRRRVGAVSTAVGRRLAGRHWCAACLRVSRSGSGCCAWASGGAAVRVRTTRVRGLGALVEWVLNGSCATLRVPKGPRRRGSQRLLRRLPRGRCAPARALGARQAAATPRGPGATAPPGRWARARVPTWSGRGLPPPASRGSRWVGGIHLYTRTRGGARSAWRPPPGCCTRKAVGCATGATARGTGPWCARRSIWRPAGARTQEERRFSTRTGGASTPPSSSPSVWGDMRSSLPRA